MSGGEGIEEAARRLRLEVWKKIADLPGDAVALGHNADDRAEGFMLRMMRGANLSGADSLREVRKILGLTILRPLLSLPRKEIEAFLLRNGVRDWRHDSSNDDEKFRRNMLRSSVFGAIRKRCPSAMRGIQISLECISEDTDFIEAEALRIFNGISDSAAFTPDFFMRQHPAMRARLARLWLSERLGRDFIPSFSLLKRIEEETSKIIADPSSGDKFLIPLDGEHFLQIANSPFIITRGKVKPAEISAKWDWRNRREKKFMGCMLSVEITEIRPDAGTLKQTNCACFDADRLPSVLLLRTRRDGDKILPFGGRNGATRVKKILSAVRSNKFKDSNAIVLLCSGGREILWICGIRRSGAAPITDKTAKFAVFSIAQF